MFVTLCWKFVSLDQTKDLISLFAFFPGIFEARILPPAELLQQQNSGRVSWECGPQPLPLQPPGQPEPSQQFIQWFCHQSCQQAEQQCQQERVLQRPLLPQNLKLWVDEEKEEAEKCQRWGRLPLELRRPLKHQHRSDRAGYLRGILHAQPRVMVSDCLTTPVAMKPPSSSKPPTTGRKRIYGVERCKHGQRWPLQQKNSIKLKYIRVGMSDLWELKHSPRQVIATDCAKRLSNSIRGETKKLVTK